MGADWNWLSVELAEDGDRETVIRAIEEDREDDRVRMTFDTDQDGTLVFDGPAGYPRAEERLGSVADHVRRAVSVQNWDTAGEDLAIYYEVRDGELERVGELRPAGPWARAACLDHFARRYDVHGPF